MLSWAWPKHVLTTKLEKDCLNLARPGFSRLAQCSPRHARYSLPSPSFSTSVLYRHPPGLLYSFHMIIPPDATAPSEEQAIEDLMSGTTSSLIISHPGISQYITGGLSSCGLACFNCARIILGREREGLRGLALLNEIVKLQTTQVHGSHLFNSLN